LRESRPKLFEEVAFKHETREANDDTHLVARNAISNEFGHQVWFMEPPDFVPLIVIKPLCFPIKKPDELL
jgi:hypothetical protein